MESVVTPSSNVSQYLTRQQAAECISSAEITIDRLIRDGKLPAFKLSKRFVRIKRSDLDKLIENNTVGGTASHSHNSTPTTTQQKSASHIKARRKTKGGC